LKIPAAGFPKPARWQSTQSQAIAAGNLIQMMVGEIQGQRVGSAIFDGECASTR